MKTELLYLVYVTILTGLLWVPYILDRIAKWGLIAAVGYPDNPPAQSPWARRLMKAHFNAVENLVVFAALVLAANALGVTGGAIATAAMVYSGRAWCTCSPTPSQFPGCARSPLRLGSSRRPPSPGRSWRSN